MWSTLCSTEPLLRPLLLAPVCNKKQKNNKKRRKTLTKKKEKSMCIIHKTLFRSRSGHIYIKKKKKSSHQKDSTHSLTLHVCATRPGDACGVPLALFLDHSELHRLSSVERSEPFRVDDGVMHKNVSKHRLGVVLRKKKNKN